MIVKLELEKSYIVRTLGQGNLNYEMIVKQVRENWSSNDCTLELGKSEVRNDLKLEREKSE